MDGDKDIAEKPKITEKSVSITEPDNRASQKAAVKEWNKKIGAACVKFEKDFNRMKLNCAFLAGYQWPGQKTLEWQKSVINVTLQMTKDIASNLYARNPKISVDRRKTMDFEIWDESLDSLRAATMVAQSPLMALSQGELLQQLQAKAQAQALLQDVQIGQQWRKQVDKVATTLLTCHEWNVANAQPSYKKQLKQMVMRTLVCGVGYQASDFTRAYEGMIAQGEIESTILDRQKRAQYLAEKLSKGDIKKDGPEVQEMISLVNSLTQSAENNDGNNVHERICWSYPLSWSIVPDPACTNLVDFIGADWISEQILKPLDTVNAYFETDVTIGAAEGGAKEYGSDGRDGQGETEDADPKKTKRVMLRHVYQLSTKSHFYIVDGWKDYVMEPEPVSPETNYFWPIRPLVFNNIEPTHDTDHPVSIFPPSHVDVLRDPQREINRCSQYLRKHRQNNLPKFLYLAGLVEESDVRAISNAEDSQVIAVKTLQPGQKMSDVLFPFSGAPLHPELADIGPQIRDMSLVTTTGQGAASGPQNHKQTATAAHIQEQTRVAVLSSDVDTLDEFLTTGAEQEGEMLLRELSPDVAKRIAGRGAVWPSDTKMRQEFIQALTLTIKAASSGRPNQALRVANGERLLPILIQAITQEGGSLEPVVEEIAHALDETLDVTKFFKPASPQAMMARNGPPPAPPAPPAQGGKPPQPGAQKPPQRQPLTHGPPAMALHQ